MCGNYCQNIAAVNSGKNCWKSGTRFVICRSPLKLSAMVAKSMSGGPVPMGTAGKRLFTPGLALAQDVPIAVGAMPFPV